MFPQVRRVAVLANEIDPFAAPFVAQLSQSARSIGMEIEPILVRPDAPQEPAFAAMSAKRVDAFIIELGTIRSETAELAINHRLPSSGPRAWPLAGGLIEYSGNPAEINRLAADYVEKILKSRKPAECKSHIAQQREIIQELLQNGQDTELAVSMLHVGLASLSATER